ncbi:unnamed protein product [Vicia faba]|uniref:RRM domain-containing protein n=1 Tax=Vicia faba TaxID=3906 RepID=A0AAV0YWH5_VICFA|nr:unnamed protein product [Vicia faba]
MENPLPSPPNPNNAQLPTEVNDDIDEQVAEEEHDDEEQRGEVETLENQNQQAVVEVSNPTAASTETVKANSVEEIETNNEEEEDIDLEDELVKKLLEPFTKEQLHALVKQAIEKYPDLSENVHSLPDVDPTQRKTFIHGLGWDATSKTLTRVFHKYDEIEDCKAVTDKTSGKLKGYAFMIKCCVSYATSEVGVFAVRFGRF